MSSTAVIAFPCLVEAVNFLTCSLSLILPQPSVTSVRDILLSTLSATPAWLHNAHLTLTFSSAAPPRAVDFACVAAHIDWSDWFFVLGGREFDLTIENTAVSVRVTGIPGRAVIWKQAPTVRRSLAPSTTLSNPKPKRQVPISRYIRQNKDTPSVTSPHAALPKTLAQQLLQSEHEEEEADEIFALISRLDACGISPTPIRERFNAPKMPVPRAPVPSRLTRPSILEEEIFHSHFAFRQSAHAYGRNTPSPVSSAESSRSNSPLSSTFSYSSSQESLTSVSTTSSSLSPPVKAIAQPFIPTSERRLTVPRREVFVPLPVANPPTRKIQRYLYQGGQSTTLTGGVMLGAASQAAPSRSQGELLAANKKFHRFRRDNTSQNQSRARTGPKMSTCGIDQRF
ncbi:hypothetical protein D9756_010562 [Leucocoprinus leucothites]|uniref:Anti-proliferative protein domain-containing protein n=1 Tax=Leucocoprinus leucothites TaxID=201217 RepID=A0A8H5FS79_9AGAR|nr:hypothetical protein D9756_010562 [Leucoagaricus leucothites]